MTTVELVLARYNEDTAWAEDLGVPVRVYDKGEHYGLPITSKRVTLSGPVLCVETLPNVGREPHTYLTHILDRWDSLADWTVFAQADPMPHLRGIDLRNLLRPVGRFRLPFHVRLREWGDDGRLQWQGEWAERYAGGEIKPAALSLVDYFRAYLGEPPAGTVAYHPGACFAVSRAAIHDRPYDFYARLLETVSGHAHPEEAHYLERAWPRIFTDGKGW